MTPRAVLQQLIGKKSIGKMNTLPIYKKYHDISSPWKESIRQIFYPSRIMAKRDMIEKENWGDLSVNLGEYSPIFLIELVEHKQ